MGKIIANVICTLDGIFTGPKGEEENMVSWGLPGIMDSDQDGLFMFQNCEAILMGRVTYEGFQSFWPFQTGEWADVMNKTQKYVVSNELKEVNWGDYNNTISLINTDIKLQIEQLKKETNGVILVSASASLMQSLMNNGLLDEIHILLHPIILGSGRHYFENIANPNHLKLISTKIYENSGAIQLKYQII